MRNTMLLCAMLCLALATAAYGQRIIIEDFNDDTIADGFYTDVPYGEGTWEDNGDGTWRFAAAGDWGMPTVFSPEFEGGSFTITARSLNHERAEDQAGGAAIMLLGTPSTIAFEWLVGMSETATPPPPAPLWLELRDGPGKAADRVILETDDVFDEIYAGTYPEPLVMEMVYDASVPGEEFRFYYTFGDDPRTLWYTYSPPDFDTGPFGTGPFSAWFMIMAGTGVAAPAHSADVDFFQIVGDITSEYAQDLPTPVPTPESPADAGAFHWELY